MGMESDRDTIIFNIEIDETSEGVHWEIRGRIRLHAKNNNNRRFWGGKEQPDDKIHGRAVCVKLYDDNRDQSFMENDPSRQHEDKAEYLGYSRTGKVQNNNKELLSEYKWSYHCF